MNKIFYVTLLIFSLSSNISLAANKPFTLRLIRALPVEGHNNVQPSGLTILNGDLYTVSDKHDYTIFRIEIKEEVAILKPYIQIIMPETLKVNLPLDFEGITNDDAGNFCARGALSSAKLFFVSFVSVQMVKMFPGYHQT